MRPMRAKGDAKLMLELEAELRSRQTPYKELGKLTGLSPRYVALVVGRLIRKKREKVIVSRETSTNLQTSESDESEDSGA